MVLNKLVQKRVVGSLHQAFKIERSIQWSPHGECLRSIEILVETHLLEQRGKLRELRIGLYVLPKGGIGIALHSGIGNIMVVPIGAGGGQGSQCESHDCHYVSIYLFHIHDSIRN